jgi:uncharacterized membrane protein
MRKIDYSHGLGLFLACTLSAIGFYGVLWLLLAIGVMLGY